jgi:POT family proton-dependent oligopeptide transporter
MVNVGGTFGPIVAGKLRAVSWNYAFMAAAAAIVVMLVITMLFYKEPEREIEGLTLRQKLGEIGVALSDVRFTIFLVLLGLFFWLPFWSFFNLCALYVDSSISTARLYEAMRHVLGSGIAGFFSHEENGVRKVLGETISNTGYIILIFQILISSILERFRAMPAFLFGLLMISSGFIVLGFAAVSAPALIFLGIFLFAVGEMISSPRIQEYITWIAPKEKAGLYMGSNFLAVGLGGALSGVTYTWLYGYFGDKGVPQYVWYALAAHVLVGIFVLWLFTRLAGEFKEREE